MHRLWPWLTAACLIACALLAYRCLRQRAEIADLRAANSSIEDRSRQRVFDLERELTAAYSAKAKAEQRLEEEDRAASDPAHAFIQSWLVRVDKLKRRLEEKPDQKIPELKFATLLDWLDAAQRDLETENDYRLALSRLRNAAMSHFDQILEGALAKYSDATGGQFPTDLSQLRPYFATSVDPAVLDRYQVASAGTSGFNGFGDQIITQKSVVDPENDEIMIFGPKGQGSLGGGVN